jgi:hypothetical protein
LVSTAVGDSGLRGLPDVADAGNSRVRLVVMWQAHQGQSSEQSDDHNCRQQLFDGIAVSLQAGHNDILDEQMRHRATSIVARRVRAVE